MKLIFIRHGEIDLDSGILNKKGKKQMKNVATYLKNEKINAIYCSPRVRAVQSANIINKVFNSEVFIDEGLNERQISSAIKNEENKKLFEENYLNYHFQSDDFETCKDFIDRLFISLKKITESYPPRSTIIIVAHSSTLYGINAYINGIPFNKKIRWMQCNNGDVIKFII